MTEPIEKCQTQWHGFWLLVAGLIVYEEAVGLENYNRAVGELFFKHRYLFKRERREE